eukprot:scaffold158467_cov28-Tisochrysis_lutea.AAC.3
MPPVETGEADAASGSSGADSTLASSAESSSGSASSCEDRGAPRRRAYGASLLPFELPFFRDRRASDSLNSGAVPSSAASCSSSSIGPCRRRSNSSTSITKGSSEARSRSCMMVR